jgi:hypothetical protein
MKKYIIVMLVLSVVLHWYVKTALKNTTSIIQKATSTFVPLKFQQKEQPAKKQVSIPQRNRALLGRRVPRKVATLK